MAVLVGLTGLHLLVCFSTIIHIMCEVYPQWIRYEGYIENIIST